MFDREWTLFDYFKLFWKKKRTIIFVVFVVSVFSIIISLILPKWYRATSVILPPLSEGSSISTMSMLSDFGFGGMIGNDNAQNRYMAILKSKTLHRQIVEKFKLADHYESDNIQEANLHFREKLSINLGEEMQISVSFIDKDQEQYFEGVTLDYEDGLAGGGFKFTDLPRVPKKYKGTIAEKVVKVIDDEINPGIASHGGFVNLERVQGNTIFITMGGGCQGCAASAITLRRGIHTAFRSAVPQIGAIYDETDHAAGTNPYFNEIPAGMA